MTTVAMGGLHFTQGWGGGVYIEKRVPLVSHDNKYSSTADRAVVEKWDLTAQEWVELVAQMSAFPITTRILNQLRSFHAGEPDLPGGDV